MNRVRFGLVRIDDRLLHGQVMLNWVRALRPKRIVVVDDKLVRDDFARGLLFAVVPPGIALWVGGVIEAASALLVRSDLSPQATMVLLRSPELALALYEAGVRFAELNVGCVGMQPGRVRIAPQVSLTKAEIEALKSLARFGVIVSFQALPSDKAIDIEKVLCGVSF